MRKTLFALSIAGALLATHAPAYAADLTAQQKYEALASKGIFAGIDGQSALDQNMNRAQFARVAALLLGLEGIGTPDTKVITEKPFSDVQLTHWAVEEIAAAKEAGVLVGNADGTFNPRGDMTVQELAVVVAKNLGLERADNASVEGAAPWAAGYIQAIEDAGVAFPTNYTDAATRADLASLAFRSDVQIPTQAEIAAQVISEAVKANPDQAAAIVADAIKADPSQAALITRAAVAAAPNQAGAITSAAVAAAPDEKDAITQAAISAAPSETAAIQAAANAATATPGDTSLASNAGAPINNSSVPGSSGGGGGGGDPTASPSTVVP